MNKLKSILLGIASLSKRDQQWVLNQLPPEKAKRFAQYQGYELLTQAKRFAQLPIPELTVSQPLFPAYCNELIQHPPLYVAIILEQGAFSWKEHFIKEYIQHSGIESLPDNELRQLKTATKEALFTQWQTTLPFAAQLELDYGTDH